MQTTSYEIADVMRRTCAVNVRNDDIDNIVKEYEHESLNKKFKKL